MMIREMMMLSILLAPDPKPKPNIGLEVTVEIQGAKGYVCKQKSVPTAGLKVLGLEKDEKAKLELRKGDKRLVPVAGKPWNYLAEPNDALSLTVIVDEGGPPVDPSCKDTSLIMPPKPGKDDEDEPKLNMSLSMLAADARDYLTKQRIVGHEYGKVKARGRRWRRTLYFLPDGSPAFPIPANIEEGEIIVIAVVVPRGSAVAVERTACEPLGTARVRGSIGDAMDDLAAFSEATAGKTAAPEWALLESGEFRCSDALSFDLDISIPTTKSNNDPNAPAAPDTPLTVSASHEFELDDVFYFSVGVGLAFDFGRPTLTALGDRPLMDMSGTEKYVVQSNELGGPVPVITIGAHPGGANPNDWRVGDWFSPTVVLDPTRLAQGFGVGLTFSPTPWFGVLVAANMYESTVLPEGVAVAVGDTWTLPGDVPVVQRFDRNSFGAFVGLTLTSDVFRAIAGKREKKAKKAAKTTTQE